MEHDWKEKKEKLIHLPDDQIEVFGLYCAWLYARDPLGLTHPIPCKCPNNREELNNYNELLRRAWQFGDKILDHDFCDMVIDNLISHCSSCNTWSNREVFILYQSCTAGVPVRQLLTDIYV